MRITPRLLPAPWTQSSRNQTQRSYIPALSRAGSGSASRNNRAARNCAFPTPCALALRAWNTARSKVNPCPRALPLLGTDPAPRARPAVRTLRSLAQAAPDAGTRPSPPQRRKRRRAGQALPRCSGNPAAPALPARGARPPRTSRAVPGRVTPGPAPTSEGASPGRLPHPPYPHQTSPPGTEARGEVRPPPPLRATASPPGQPAAVPQAPARRAASGAAGGVRGQRSPPVSRLTREPVPPRPRAAFDSPREGRLPAGRTSHWLCHHRGVGAL